MSGFLGFGKKKDAAATKSPSPAASPAASASPASADPAQPMGNAYINTLLTTGDHAKGPIAGAAAPTPEQIKALGAGMKSAKTAEASGMAPADAWQRVDPALQPDRMFGDLSLYNDVAAHVSGADAAKKADAAVLASAPKPAARAPQDTRLPGFTAAHDALASAGRARSLPKEGAATPQDALTKKAAAIAGASDVRARSLPTEGAAAPKDALTAKAAAVAGRSAVHARSLPAEGEATPQDALTAKAAGLAGRSDVRARTLPAEGAATPQDALTTKAAGVAGRSAVHARSLPSEGSAAPADALTAKAAAVAGRSDVRAASLPQDGPAPKDALTAKAAAVAGRSDVRAASLPTSGAAPQDALTAKAAEARASATPRGRRSGPISGIHKDPVTGRWVDDVPATAPPTPIGPALPPDPMLAKKAGVSSTLAGQEGEFATPDMGVRPASKPAAPKDLGSKAPIRSGAVEAGLDVGGTVGTVGSVVNSAAEYSGVASRLDYGQLAGMDTSSLKPAEEHRDAMRGDVAGDAIGVASSGLGLGKAILQSQRADVLKTGNATQQALGETLSDRADTQGVSSGASLLEGAAKMGLHGAKIAGDSGAVDAFGAMVPGLGIAASAASLARNVQTYDEMSGYSDKNKGVVADLAKAENPMAKLAENNQGQFDKQKGRAKRGAVLDTAMIGAHATAIAAPPAGALATGAVGAAKGLNAAGELVSDNLAAHEVQGLRTEAAAGSRKAKRDLLVKDPRIASTGVAMYAGKDASAAADPTERQRIEGANAISGAMGMTPEAMAAGSERDRAELVTQRTKADPGMLMSHQKLNQALQTKILGKADPYSVAASGVPTAPPTPGSPGSAAPAKAPPKPLGPADDVMPTARPLTAPVAKPDTADGWD